MGPTFKIRSKIEQIIDLKLVMEEGILDNLVEFTLREILGIAKKKSHDVIIDFMKRKRQSTTEDEPKPMNVCLIELTRYFEFHST